jgi:hypothetical protein
VDDLVDEDRSWLPKVGPDGRRVSVAIDPWPGATAQDAWKEAAQRWQEHGTANGLRMDPARLQTYMAKAEEYCRLRPGLRVGDPTPPLTPEESSDPHLNDLYDAHVVMHAWGANRYLTNYESFELEADALQTDDALLAKKRFRQADKAARVPNYSEAVRLYDEGFAAWKRLLVAKQDCRARRTADPSLANQRCRDFRDLDNAQDTAYELNVKYVRLAQDVRQRQLREAAQWVHDLVSRGGGATTGNPFQVALDLTVLSQDVEVPGANPGDPARIETRAPQLRAIPALPLPGPLDGNAPDGTPWMSEDVQRRVKERLGLVKPQAPPPAVAPGGDAARPGGDAARPPGP